MSEAIKLFQYNTLSALMAGLYGGTLTIGELLEHGDLGIGTLDSIDGELIQTENLKLLRFLMMSKFLTLQLFLIKQK